MSLSDDQIGLIFSSLGRIEQKIDGHIGVVSAHVEHDEKVQKALFERVEFLQLSHAKQKGALTVLGAVGSMLGAGVGYLIERFITHH